MGKLTWISTLALVITLLASACGSDDEEKKADEPICGGQAQCVGDDGADNLGLCSDSTDWLCVKGCCVEKKPCATNADCAVQVGTAACKDDLLLCACHVGSGQCVQAACATDSECGEGMLCNNGGCHTAPAAADLSAHLLRPFLIARPTDTIVAATALAAQARDAKGATAPDSEFDWSLSGDAFVLADGKLTAGAKAGFATVTARVKGGAKDSLPAKLWNLGPLASGAALRLTVADESTLAPVAGKVVVVGLADATTPAAALVLDLTDGQATFDKVQWPADVHIIGVKHEPVSILRLDASAKPADLVVTARQYHLAALEFTVDNELADTAELINGDLLGGNVEYKGKGEAALGITSLGVGTDLLSFNLDAIIGPNVKRFFHPDTPTIFGAVDKPQELPGGATFRLNGKPVLNSYVLAAPPGNKILWSLAGRIDINADPTLVTKIVESVAGDADVGKIVGALLPYLQEFYSQVSMDRTFEETPVKPMKTLDLAPSVPLLLKTEVKPAALPKDGDAWADLLLVVAGAMMPNGQLVPLGISAATDVNSKNETPDGRVDGDAKVDGDQPLPLTCAPLHSGLRYGEGNYAVATAAVVVAGNGKREAGSIILSASGPFQPQYAPGDFLPFADGSAYGDVSRELLVAPVKGAHFYRAILTGPKSRSWQVIVAENATGKALRLPDLTQWGAAVDAGKDPKRAFIGAFEMRNASGFAEIMAPGGITDLVRQVKRTSFIDVHQ